MTACVSHRAGAVTDPLLHTLHTSAGCRGQADTAAPGTALPVSNTRAPVEKRPPSSCTSRSSCDTASAAAPDTCVRESHHYSPPHKAAAVAPANVPGAGTRARHQMEASAREENAQRSQAAASASSSNGAQGFSMEGKSIVRISPALLGSIGEAAAAVTEGSLIVQFAGRCLHFNEDTEWHVTHAILSNSLAVSSHETRSRRNQQVDDVMRSRELTHIGWLRQASVSCPLSSLDLDTQRVYEEHLADSFAAMLDMAHPDKGPIVYFYCLANPSAAATDASYNAFAAAHHVVLDTSVPFVIVEVSLEQGASAGGGAAGALDGGRIEAKKSLPGSNDTNTTGGEAQTHATFAKGEMPAADDDCMSLSIL